MCKLSSVAHLRLRHARLCGRLAAHSAVPMSRSSFARVPRRVLHDINARTRASVGSMLSGGHTAAVVQVHAWKHTSISARTRMMWVYKASRLLGAHSAVSASSCLEAHLQLRHAGLCGRLAAYSAVSRHDRRRFRRYRDAYFRCQHAQRACERRKPSGVRRYHMYWPLIVPTK
jgi:hypothetical protein